MEQIASLQPPESAPEVIIDVWPENWPAVQVFAACATAWRLAVGLTTQRVGLDYPSAEAVCRGLGIRWRAVFRPLQVMERAALGVWNRQKQPR